MATPASPLGQGSLFGDVSGKGRQEKALHVHLNYVRCVEKILERYLALSQARQLQQL